MRALPLLLLAGCVSPADAVSGPFRRVQGIFQGTMTNPSSTLGGIANDGWIAEAQSPTRVMLSGSYTTPMGAMNCRLLFSVSDGLGLKLLPESPGCDADGGTCAFHAAPGEGVGGANDEAVKVEGSVGLSCGESPGEGAFTFNGTR